MGSTNISAGDCGCVDILSIQIFAVCLCETVRFMLSRVAVCSRRMAYTIRRELLLIQTGLHDWRSVPSLIWDAQDSRPAQMHDGLWFDDCLPAVVADPGLVASSKRVYSDDLHPR